MILHDNLVGVELRGFVGRHRRWDGLRLGRSIWFENVKAFEFLIENGERLESLGFEHLLLKPILNFILLVFFQVLVVVVEMPINLSQKSD